MIADDTYLQVKWTRTSYNHFSRSVLKIPKDNVRFMCKSNLMKDPTLDKDGYSYMPSLGAIYLKYEDRIIKSRITKSEIKVRDINMILPLNLLLFKYQIIYPQNDYKMKCKCTEKGSKFDFLLSRPTVKEVIKGIIDKIVEHHINLLSDINICLEDDYIRGIYFIYKDSKGKKQRFLGR